MAPEGRRERYDSELEAWWGDHSRRKAEGMAQATWGELTKKLKSIWFAAGDPRVTAANVDALQLAVSNSGLKKLRIAHSAMWDVRKRHGEDAAITT